MSIERFVAWVFQHDDIRDLITTPQTRGLTFATQRLVVRSIRSCSELPIVTKASWH